MPNVVPLCLQYKALGTGLLGTSLAASEDGSQVVACAPGFDVWVGLTKTTDSSGQSLARPLLALPMTRPYSPHITLRSSEHLLPRFCACLEDPRPC